MQIIIAGAGLSGAVTARQLAEAGHRVTIYESRSHVAGNCHTQRCSETGVLLHQYGPHIFHTDDTEVWEYVNRHARFHPYQHRVLSTVGERVFSMPINLLTINQVFGKSMRPEEARVFIEETQADRSIIEPQTFEEQALRFVGPVLYEMFFKGYTEKQWGRAPSELPASILKRLPLRFTYDDNYFAHRFQGMPEDGYTPMVSSILDHPGIDLHLETPFNQDLHGKGDHLIWTGPLDAFFKHTLGQLGYRTLDFERFVADGDYQGCAVMNYGDANIPHTRVTEHSHFAPWEQHEKTVCYRETARECSANDIPYYPIRLANEKAMLHEYEALAITEEGVSFLGRLGTYRYLDMDVTIREALDLSRRLLDRFGEGQT